MAPGLRRYAFMAVAFATAVLIWRMSDPRQTKFNYPSASHHEPTSERIGNDEFRWRDLKENYPVTSFRSLPVAGAKPLPKVQADFLPETSEDEAVRLSHQKAIKESFLRCWAAYKDHAWLKDEVTPVSGQSKDTFGGWGATLIDSLDTLWMMDLKDEFEMAVEAVDTKISFETTQSEEINVFETTIRFLGGLLSAYDLSQDRRLLSKARDVGDLLYKAFDTPNHLPVLRWKLHEAADGADQVASSGSLLAEIGSLCMEFTRLSLLTEDPKYFDATEKIGELLAKSQKDTNLPGMWPIVVDAENENFDAGNDYALGGMADSTFEYLPKMVALLGDGDSKYGQMYSESMRTARDHLFYRPMTPKNEDILFAGVVRKGSREAGDTMQTSTGHLTCFVGGMLALGGKLIGSTEHGSQAAAMTRGCIWAYASFGTGVMPETMDLVSCGGISECEWDEEKWHKAVLSAQPDETDPLAVIKDQRLPSGFTKIPDPRYILRPEAIESVFIMWRTTGDSYWRERAWEMWTAIDKLTRTDLANTAVWDVNPKDPTDVSGSDSMESFWMGETLKYFYLIFSEPDLMSLDEWVFNTEAHPFKRLK